MPVLKKETLIFFAICLALLGAVLFVYYPTLAFGFLRWDDKLNITENPLIKSGSWFEFWKKSYYGFYIPVTYSVWSFLSWLGDGGALVFRAFNLLLHLLNTVLVGVAAHLILRNLGIKSRPVICLICAIFALHPSQIEAVAWVSGGRDLLSAFFILVSLIFIVQKEINYRLIFGFIFYVLAVLSKPSVVSFPVIAILVELFVNQTPRKKLYGYVLWFVVPIMALVLNIAPQQEMISHQSSFLQRLWVVCDSIGFYLYKMVLPASLSTDYGRSPALVMANWSEYLPSALLGLLFVILLIYLILAKKSKASLFGICWVISLIPVLGIIPFAFQEFSTVADRYTYLPLFFALLFFGCLLQRWPLGHIKQWKYISVLTVVLISFFVVIGSARVASWQDDSSFFKAMVESNPKSFMGLMGLGSLSSEKGDQAEALRKFAAAESVRKNDIEALGAILMTRIKLGEYALVKESEAAFMVRDLDKQITTGKSGFANVLTSLGFAHYYLGDKQRALEYFCLSVRGQPVNSLFHEYLQRAAVTIKGGADYPCPGDLTFNALVDRYQRGK